VRNGGGAWLTLGQASRALGVTANTLRRWADQGRIPSFTTPGGHRRFPVTAVRALVPADRERRPALTSLGASSDRMVTVYRRARRAGRASAAPSWLARLSDSDRARFREHGIRLVAALLAHLDATRDEAPRLLRRADTDARAYGRLASEAGASLADAVDGFLRFRKPFVDELGAVARRRHLDTREATALLADAEVALDSLLLAVMAGYSGRKR